MIVYNAGTRWFEKQEDAKAHARSLPRRSPVTRVRVESREDLAALLNALCGASTPRVDVVLPAGPVKPTDKVERVTVAAAAGNPAWRGLDANVPDFVPLFLIEPPDRREAVRKDREKRGWNPDDLA